MQATWACLSCALKQIPDTQQPLLIQAKSHLEVAIKYSSEYYAVSNSIMWIYSKESTKRRVREQLNNLAFDCYSNFIIASEYLNEYADVMNKERVAVSKWWCELVISLSLAYDAIQKENRDEIYSKQLGLM